SLIEDVRSRVSSLYAESILTRTAACHGSFAMASCDQPAASCPKGSSRRSLREQERAPPAFVRSSTSVGMADEVLGCVRNRAAAHDGRHHDNLAAIRRGGSGDARLVGDRS